MELTCLNANISLSELEIGQKVTAKVVRIGSNWALCDIGIEGDGALLHASQISDEPIADLSDVLKMGEAIEAAVRSIDALKRRVELTCLTSAKTMDR